MTSHGCKNRKVQDKMASYLHKFGKVRAKCRAITKSEGLRQKEQLLAQNAIDLSSKDC